MNDSKKAEQFLLNCIRGGLAHSFDTKTNTWVKPYPEVTGYLLSYFSHKQHLDSKIIDAANTLISIQDKTGGFPSFFNTDFLYTFDTAQIAHGLVSIYLKTGNKIFNDAARKSGEFLLSMLQSDGSFFPMFHRRDRYKHVEQINAEGTNWGSHFSYIQVKNSEALLLLRKITKDPRYDKAVQLIRLWGGKQNDPRYTHPYGYYLEGMIACGEKDSVTKKLEQYIVPRERDGFISYKKTLPYSYVSGSIQLGILLAKTGKYSTAKRIYSWASQVQQHHSSGGLFQYANKDSYPNTEIHVELNSWGTKYFLELSSLIFE